MNQNKNLWSTGNQEVVGRENDAMDPNGTSPAAIPKKNIVNMID